MRSNRTMMFAGVLGAMSAAMAVAAPMEPAAEPEPGSAHNRPSGSKPVPGGGAKERARRLARMPAAEPECRCDTFNQFLCPKHE
jgi:hypothetical protein